MLYFRKQNGFYANVHNIDKVPWVDFPFKNTK